MTTTPQVSVVICTHNRLKFLQTAIASLVRQEAPGIFEAIVVDNASTDETPLWIAQIQRTVPFLTYLREDSLGLAVARNTGWQNARAEVVAFLDDDAIAAPDWIAGITAKFQHCSDRVAIISGKVEPRWEIPPPKWLGPELWPFLSTLDWSPDDVILQPEQHCVGANMIIRKKILVKFRGFHAALGRKGQQLLSNEEVMFKRAVEEAGYQTLYVPGIKVQHWVPADRMTPAWFRRRFFWQGVSDALMESALRHNSIGAAARVRGLVTNARMTLALIVRRAKLHFARLRWPSTSLNPEFHWQQDFGYVIGRWRILLRTFG